MIQIDKSFKEVISIAKQGLFLDTIQDMLI